VSAQRSAVVAPPKQSEGERFAAFMRRLYHFHFQSKRRERLFFASIGFLATSLIVRGITHMIRAGVGPIHNISSGGLHIHHLVWGILLLLLVGYIWLAEVGVGWSWTSAVTAVAYGVGAALALDEFALWLNLRDVYWESQGRESVNALLIFGGLLGMGAFGGPFLFGLARHLWTRIRR
jgi:hypothetical protein